MKLLFKEGTRKTPVISFDPHSGNFEISGRSFPDMAFEFYQHLFDWLDNYLEVPLSTTTVTFNMDYFDTSSYRCFLEILKKLERVQDKNHKVFVRWLYERNDEEIKEAGEDLSEATKLDILVRESDFKTID